MRSDKSRKLSAAEARRLAHFDAICTELQARGYRKTDLTIGLVAANVAVLAAAIPLAFIWFAVFFWANPDASFSLAGNEIVLLLVAFAVLVVVHELAHGVTWSMFAEHGMKDIEFGFMKETLTPYCTCTTALPRGKYLIGALMPLLLLGILPSIAAVAIGWSWLLVVGFVMTLSAGGDVMIAIKLLAYRSNADEVLWYDHPTEAGGVIFER